MSKALQIKKLASGVVVITIDLPGSKLNLLSESVLRELDEAISSLESDSTVKGVILVSGKEDNFGAGANVEEIQALQSRPAVEIYEASKAGKAVFSRLAKLNSIAAIHGLSLGGYTELAVWCSKRIATRDGVTKIGVPEVQLGFLPGWGGTVRLPRMIGLMPAFTLMSIGNPVSARAAWKMGLVDEVVEREELVNRAEAILLGARPKRYSPGLFSVKERLVRCGQALLQNNNLGRFVFKKMATGQVYAKTRGKYPAPFEILKVALASVSGSEEAAYELESQAFARLATTDVSRNCVSIFFGETESKRMPEGVEPAVQVKTVGVLGAGVMGAGIAQAAAFSGYKVVLKDIDQDALDKGMKTIKGLFDKLVSIRKLTREKADALFGNITATLDYADMSECDLVIEAVAENLVVKKIVRGELDKVITRPYIFASNTSSLSVSDMMEGHDDDEKDLHIAPAAYPELGVGLHFFNPVHKMPLVEVVQAKSTSPEALVAAKAFAISLGKKTVVVNDAPGFVVNRLLAPYMREAIVMAGEGVPLADIEKAAQSFGMAMGPFNLLDTVGLDIAGHVIDTLHGALGDRMSPPPILADIEPLGLLGQKGGRGFYLYDERGKRKSVKVGKAFRKKKKYVFNPDVLEAIARRADTNKKTITEIQDRLFLAMVAEAVLCLEEGVVDTASQLDFAMIFGCGFPPFTGGVLRYADSLGSTLLCQKLEWLERMAGENYRACSLLKVKAASGESLLAAA